MDACFLQKTLSLSAALARLMALVAIDAVVDVAGDLLVVEVAGVVASVAASALEDRIIVGVDVAGGAHVVGVAVVGGEGCVLRVVERRVGPGRRGVAALTGRGEELRLRRVAGIGRVVVVGLMASDAGGRQRRVIVVHVAVAALPWRHRVRTSQGESSVVVIEC